MLERGRHGTHVKMLPSPVATRPDFFRLIISLWASTTTTTLVRAANAPAPAAAAENGFVPDCASGCYQAFIENNRFLDACGSNPSLQCLCSRYGSTGATFGEGAVQCMAAEMNLGRCAGSQVPPASMTGAYSVCHTIAGFAAPTQSVIVATTISQTRTYTQSTSEPPLTTPSRAFSSSNSSSALSSSNSSRVSSTTSSRAFSGSTASRIFFSSIITSSSTISSTSSTSTTASSSKTTSSSTTSSTAATSSSSKTSSTAVTSSSSFSSSFSTSTASSTSSTQSSSSSSSFVPTTLMTAPRETSRKEHSNPSSYNSQTITNTPIAAPIPSANPSSSSDQQPVGVARLSGGQVAGITVGAVSSLFLLIALAFFARRQRQNRLKNGEDAAGSSFDNRGAPGGGGGAFAKLRDSFGRGGSSNGGNSQARSISPSGQISGPMNVGGSTAGAWAPRPYEAIVSGPRPRASPGDMISSPDIFAGRFKPDGSAAVPATAGVTTAAALPKRLSLQFTPPQHELGCQFARTLTGSPAASVRPTLTLAIPRSRDSDVTEFAEDGEVEEAGAEEDGAQIWRPPANDMHSATTYYVADKLGNWRRRSTLKGGNAPQPGLPSNGADPSAAVAPLSVPPRRLASPTRMGRGAGSKEELSASSSVYSPMTPPQSMNAGSHEGPVPPMPPFPKSAYAKMLAMNSELSGQPGAVAQLPGTAERNNNKKPSPVSPVAYPAIPRRDVRRSMTPEQRLKHQQEQQQLARAQQSPHGQPSPTLGGAVPAKSQAVGRSLTGAAAPPPAVGASYSNPYRDTVGARSPAAGHVNNPYSDTGGLDSRAGDGAASDDEFAGARAAWTREQPKDARNLRLPSTPSWKPTLTPTRRGEDLFLKVG